VQGFRPGEPKNRAASVTFSEVTDLRVQQLYIITLHLFSLPPDGAAASDSTECAGQRCSGRSAARTMSGVLGLRPLG
jgi:hypothetical protein